MGLIIGCPYYISDKRRTVSCEGRIKAFTDKERKDGQMFLICPSLRSLSVKDLILPSPLTVLRLSLM